MDANQFAKKANIFFITFVSSTVLAIIFSLLWITSVIIEKEVRMLYYVMVLFSIASICMAAFIVILSGYLAICGFIHEHKCKKAEHKEKGKEQ